jgi:hypothetical protein
MDAVIILKEQSVNVENTSVNYRGMTFTGPSITTTRVFIVKLFNEAAVKKYGSVELSYRERFGNEIPCGYMARARVLKPEGQINKVNENEVNNIVTLSTPGGTPLERKLILTIPNLSAGDVLQYETQLNEPFSYTNGGIFFYNDRDYALFSNLNITLPNKQDYDIYSFPEDKIGTPKIQQLSKTYGSGETRFWSVKNLNAIPDEPYSRPFEDVSMMTCVVGKEAGRFDVSSWPKLLKRYYDDFFDKGKASSSNCEDLGLPEEKVIASIEQVDSLYYKIKKQFRLYPYSDVFPEREASDLIKAKKGDASELALLMMKILKRWKTESNPALIRDKRTGVWEKTVPTLEWFTRAGLIVNVNGVEKLYDFDRSIPNIYEFPSFLSEVDVYVINARDAVIKNVGVKTNPEDHGITEEHTITIGSDRSLYDSLSYSSRGRMAEQFREKHYELEMQGVKDNYRKKFLGSQFQTLDSVTVNDFYDSPECALRASGKLKASAEEIDSFLVIKPGNSVFSDFRNTLYSARRKTDIILPAALKLKLVNKIKLPGGYKLKSAVVNKNVSSPFKAEFNISSKEENGMLTVTCELVFKEEAIKQSYFKDLISLIDKAISEAGRDIVLIR